MKQRVCCFVDGFNLYHAIDALHEPQLKWVDLWGLSEAFITPASERLVAVHYFTALAYWLDEPRRRHRAFIAANQHLGVSVTLGHFKEKPRTCRRCGARHIQREEKESDVNLAIQLLHGAASDGFDRALVISADSDLCPPIRLIQQSYPHKRVTVLAPPNRYAQCRDFRSITDTRKIRRKHLQNNLLPAIAHNREGRELFRRPQAYAPPQ